LIIIEHNGYLGLSEKLTVPYFPDFCIDGQSYFFGASAAAFVDLAHQKGYSFIVNIEQNLFFLSNKHLPSGFKEPIVDQSYMTQRPPRFLVSEFQEIP
jgi:hypothetical protein